MENKNLEDQRLYEQAEARVNFKSHARIYILINILIWAFWYVTRARLGYYDGYWPVYATLGWGFGVLSHYLGVYKDNSDAIEKEMEKIRRKKGS